MTIEQLLNLPVERLEEMSDKDLENILLPYFPLTRPKGTFHVDIPPEIQALLNNHQKHTFGKKKV